VRKSCPTRRFSIKAKMNMLYISSSRTSPRIRFRRRLRLRVKAGLKFSEEKVDFSTKKKIYQLTQIKFSPQNIPKKESKDKDDQEKVRRSDTIKSAKSMTLAEAKGTI
jgi:hypothetical protein